MLLIIGRGSGGLVMKHKYEQIRKCVMQDIEKIPQKASKCHQGLTTELVLRNSQFLNVWPPEEYQSMCTQMQMSTGGRGMASPWSLSYRRL